MPQSFQIGLTIRQKEPVNLETATDQIDTFLTPSELFYIRSHFSAPDLKITGYELQVGGAVRQPLTLSYRTLREMPSETRIVTLECAGNGRVFLVPAVQGAQWELGAVGTAEWTGVPLAALLERAGVEAGACEIVLEGADRGIPAEPPVPPGPISYARSLSLRNALQGDVLIAYQMNGRDLRREHGYPVRAIVPGYFGMASVKWLTRIQAVREPFQGYWQTADYAYWDYFEGMPVRRALGPMPLKSEIFRPRVYETLPANQVYQVFGAAWTGESEVTEVSLSTDGGRTWVEAKFLDPVQRYAWRRWICDWLTPNQPGKYTLLARAKDAHGCAQPDHHDPNHGGYVINHPLPIEVFVVD
jgi:DMSO/TMAO reductase YedYZ molybdopterin-dependent catalytic subunit